MRTTLDIDDALLAEAQAGFPPGTPKTVIFEEGLRRLISSRDGVPRNASRRRDPRIERLIAEGRLTPSSSVGPPPALGGLPLRQILDDLDRDRSDR